MINAFDSEEVLSPNWRHVGIFLALTFGLTWLLDLAIYLRGGLNIPGIVTILQLQMLIPAFSAIVLGILFFRESPIFRNRPVAQERWFFNYFLVLTGVYALGVLFMWFSPAQETVTLVALTTQIVAFLGLFLLLLFRVLAGRESMARVWLSWGKMRYYLLFGVGFIVFYALQAGLNAIFDLGPSQFSFIVPPGFTTATSLIEITVQTVILAPFLAIAIAFGEEYGWRGYLQTELFKMGRLRGVLLLGVIWGVWHWPIILMGWSYPGYPLAGLVLTVLFTTGLAVVLGYAVLRSGSVILAAYLHALNDQVTAYLVALGFTPFDSVFSFGVGIYAIVTLAILAVLILRDPIWRGRGSSLPVPRD